MKKSFLLKVLSFFTLLFVCFTVFADKWLKLDNKTTNSVKLSWEKDSKASYYQINYWTNPSPDWKQSSQTEIIEWTSYDISSLKSWTKYFFNLVWYDSNWAEVFKSNDLEVSIDEDMSSTDTFSITETKLVEKNILELSFSKDLDEKKLEQAEFKVEAISDTSDYLKVKWVKLSSSSKKSIFLEFDWEPTDKVEYKVVVLAIFDDKWNNIKFWVDSETKFVWWEIYQEINDIKEAKEVDVKLDSAWPSSNETKKDEENKTNLDNKPKKQLTWESWTKEDTGKNVESLSENKEKLPQTWPEMIILLIIAFAMAMWIFILKNKKA